MSKFKSFLGKKVAIVFNCIITLVFLGVYIGLLTRPISTNMHYYSTNIEGFSFVFKPNHTIDMYFEGENMKVFGEDKVFYYAKNNLVAIGGVESDAIFNNYGSFKMMIKTIASENIDFWSENNYVEEEDIYCSINKISAFSFKFKDEIYKCKGAIVLACVGGILIIGFSIVSILGMILYCKDKRQKTDFPQ